MSKNIGSFIQEMRKSKGLAQDENYVYEQIMNQYVTGAVIKELRMLLGYLLQNFY